ncbi:MAG: hypothetical protein ACI9DC_001944 [Gammaproteobacteria bacterium]|jgi:hypothetical protein
MSESAYPLPNGPTRHRVASGLAKDTSRGVATIRSRSRFLLAIVNAVLLIICALTLPGAHAQVPNASEWPNTDFSKTLVDLDEILSGGPPKDGIPSIDSPKFVTPRAAAEWLDNREPVIVVSIGNDVRAYPVQIVMWHEIVNDTINSVPISVTFCPLCNATIIFDRRLDGSVLDFGTTGRLRKSDLVMYDRQSESWWQQFSGRAIVGELVGKTLERLPGQIVAFEDFRKDHPQGKVLSRETGHRRAYGQNPYGGYDDIDQHPFLFSDPVDPRLPAMERVLNISIDGTHHLYPFSKLGKNAVVNDSVVDQPVVVFSLDGTLSALDASQIKDSRTLPSATAWFREVDGEVLDFEARDGQIIDLQTKTQWSILGYATQGPLAGKRLRPAPGGVHFAFAWLAFNPDSNIWQGAKP